MEELTLDSPIEDLLEAHIKALRQSRLSSATQVERERVLLTLPEYPLQAGRKEYQEWWTDRLYRDDGEPRAASSLSQEQSHVRRFFRWAMRHGIVGHNAADWLPDDLRTPVPAAKPVQEGDLHKLMRDADEHRRRMIALAAMAGLRSAEIGVAQWEDIDRGNGVIWVRLSKGQRGRSVPLSAGLLSWLGEPGEGYIVGKEMTGKAVSAAVGRYMRSQGVDFTAHKLRARYATRFLSATGDLKAAADALGHADLSSIGRYVVSSNDTMRLGAEAAGQIG